MENGEHRSNLFIRALIVILCGFIGFLVWFNFFRTEPSGQITSGLVVMVLLLVVLVLSEAFDNFSIARLFTLSRSVREKEVQNSELKRENAELRNQIVTITTSVCQQQVNSTFLLTPEQARGLTVTKADEPEKEEQNKDQKEELEKITSTRKTPKDFDIFELRAAAQRIGIEKFLRESLLGRFPIIQDAKFTNMFQKMDPICEHSPIYDGYIKTLDTEIFLECHPNINSILFRDRLYLLLSKIYHYKSVKKVDAFLYLILLNREGLDTEPRTQPNMDRLYRDFEPAIANGLLKIVQMDITKEEMETELRTKKNRGDLS